MASKVIHTYKLPEALRKSPSGGDLPESIGLRELTADEELQAHKVGRFDNMKTQYDAVKRSIAEVDGKAASYADGGVDKLWEACGPKVRALLLEAYNRISSPTADEEKDFFKSEEVRAG
jgi:hypothetical protein